MWYLKSSREQKYLENVSLQNSVISQIKNDCCRQRCAENLLLIDQLCGYYSDRIRFGGVARAWGEWFGFSLKIRGRFLGSIGHAYGWCHWDWLHWGGQLLFFGKTYCFLHRQKTKYNSYEYLTSISQRVKRAFIVDNYTLTRFNF
jgi:hypothetical protein